MTATPSRPEPDGKLTSWRLVTVIGSLFLGAFLFGLDVSIIAVAIPQITTQFRSLPDVSWYGSAYMLTLTAFQPFFGNLYKYFNAKVVYLTSLGIFEGALLYMHLLFNTILHAFRLTWDTIQWDPSSVLLLLRLRSSYSAERGLV